MERQAKVAFTMATAVLAGAMFSCADFNSHNSQVEPPQKLESSSDTTVGVRPGVVVNRAFMHDTSPPLATLAGEPESDGDVRLSEAEEEDDDLPPNILAPGGAGGGGGAGAATGPATRAGGGGGGRGTGAPSHSSRTSAASPRRLRASHRTKKKWSTKAASVLVDSFDGLGTGFIGPQGSRRGGGNPSDNSLAVGPDHIVQIVNSQMAIFTKKGKKYDTTGKCLYGPVNTNRVFAGFGDPARMNGGDAVVRYDQLADRWLIVLPLFSRVPARPTEPPAPRGGEPATRSWAGVPNQPGEAATLTPPEPIGPATGPATAPGARGRRGAGGGGGGGGGGAGRGGGGSYAMCYAISTTSDPLGPYYRYEYLRPLFPDYPPARHPGATWLLCPNQYRRHGHSKASLRRRPRPRCSRAKNATEQGIIIDGVNFLNNADIDGQTPPAPRGGPNIMIAAGGSQLRNVREDDGIYWWKFHVDWSDPTKTEAEGPTKITVAPYHYLGGGQLTQAVPQPQPEGGRAPGWIPRATRSCSARRLSPHWRSGIHRSHSLHKHHG